MLPERTPSENIAYSGQFICLNCGAVMMQRQCKVRCLQCGYFEDCSDGGNDQTNFERVARPLRGKP